MAERIRVSPGRLIILDLTQILFGGGLTYSLIFAFMMRIRSYIPHSLIGWIIQSSARKPEYTQDSSMSDTKVHVDVDDSYVPKGLQPLCKACNARKKDWKVPGADITLSFGAHVSRWFRLPPGRSLDLGPQAPLSLG